VKTRTVEIPVCDRCTRDGLLLQVVPIDSDLEAFVIVRCERHVEALRAEAGAELEAEASPNGRASRAVEKAVRLVERKPGRSSGQYVSAGTTRYALARAVEAGLIRAEGQTSARRYYPIA
jgi:hypothetical protein